MPIEGIDCASSIQDPSKLIAAGKHFACRYVSTVGNPKNLSKAEADRLKAAGIGIVVVFETTADRALAGEAAGSADAKSAIAQANSCGAPADAPIYFAVDFDMQPSQWPAVRAYFDGAAHVIGRDRLGGYGGLRLVTNLAKRRSGIGMRPTCRYLWQTLAWSGTPTVWLPAAQLQQYHNGVAVAGVTADLDRAMTADYGQWGGAAAARPRRPIAVFKDGEHLRNFRTRPGAYAWLLRHRHPRKGHQVQVRHRDDGGHS